MPITVTPNGQPFVLQPRLTRIAMAIVNEAMIADQVCPRVPVGAELFQYTKVTQSERLRVPETRMGRTGRANQVEFGSTDETDRVEDHGLEDPVPVKDIDAAAASEALNPLDAATMGTTDLMDLAREIRVATLVQTAGNYASGLKLTLDGTSGKYYFDDATNGTPVAQMLDAMDGMVHRPNIAVMSQPAWTGISQHPEVVKKVLGPLATTGKVTLQALAELLELDRILVGKGWKDTAKKGQTESDARVWGNHVALLRIEPNLVSAQTVRPSFCFTATFGGRQAGTYFDPARGVKGCQVVKIIDQLKELISYQNAGYLFSNVLTP